MAYYRRSYTEDDHDLAPLNDHDAGHSTATHFFDEPVHYGYQAEHNWSELEHDIAGPAQQVPEPMAPSPTPNPVSQTPNSEATLPSLYMIILGLVSMFLPMLRELTLVLTFSCDFSGWILHSALSFSLYYIDHLHSTTNKPRIPALVLHFVDFRGGWPGAFLALYVYHYKKDDSAFRKRFWTIVAINNIYASLQVLMWLGEMAVLGKEHAEKMKAEKDGVAV
ncbi:hypothetical protein B9Z65_1035 [Elsinoe australis]|uniref:Uncharacterized protein n=1 Tax=Elsinoe australis TaxID=40998 RepID=A0A2P8AI64_9PEZI|nr:hypothetical protein B9Z65_1035 [Elsinoe australis]